MPEHHEVMRQFLTDAGLYATSDTGKVTRYVEGLTPKTLDIRCRKCLITTTNKSSHLHYTDSFVFEVYTCCRCDEENAAFALAVSSASQGYVTGVVTKVGQYPPPPVVVSKPIRKALTASQLELYQKGIRCMNIGYGLASAAYFRRLIEDTGDQFLDLIIASAEAESDDDRKQLAIAAKSGTQVKEKLKQAGELLPPSLKIGGHNPLAQMYALLSDHVHARTDEECLEESRILKEDFDYVFESISESLAKAKAMRSRLNGRLSRT